MIVDFMKGRMWAYIETGMNLIDVDDVAIGHLRAMERGRIGERYILGASEPDASRDFPDAERVDRYPGASPELLWQAILPLAHANRWFADYISRRPPRIPLEGVRMAKYHMHYDCRKAVRELGLPQTPAEVALGKAVKWFRDHNYA